MLALGIVLIVSGWCLLVLAMPKHHQALRGRPGSPARLRALRMGGWLAFAASLACFVAVIGWEQGPVFWACALMLSALAWPLLLAALPDRSPRRRR